jgi:hypothetical protein
MNGLSDTLTIGLVLALVFGALFFYLYSRIGQVEKRVSLTENILLDLKMATENTMMAMAAVPHTHMADMEDSQPERVEPIGAPEPIEKDEVEQIPDEEFYKQALQGVNLDTKEDDVTELTSTVPSKMEPNYESMTLKELKAEAKRQGIAVSGTAHKKDVIDALKRQTKTVAILEAVPGSDGVLEEGFPVEA